MPKPLKKQKEMKAWAILNDKGEPLDIQYYKPSKDGYFNIGTWTYPIGSHKVVPCTITLKL